MIRLITILLALAGLWAQIPAPGSGWGGGSS